MLRINRTGAPWGDTEQKARCTTGSKNGLIREYSGKYLRYYPQTQICRLRNRQHVIKGTSARGGCKKRAENAEIDQGIGFSCGGKNTKIHAVVDALGNPVSLHFTAGNINGCSAAVDVLSAVTIRGSIVMGDKAYGSKEIRDYITENGASYVIPPKTNASEPWDCDWRQYKERHLVECLWQ
jgi:transposase